MFYFSLTENYMVSYQSGTDPRMCYVLCLSHKLKSIMQVRILSQWSVCSSPVTLKKYLAVSIIKMTEMFMKLRHTVAKLKQDNIGSKHVKTWTNPALSRTNQGIYSKPDLIIHSSYFILFFFTWNTYTKFFRGFMWTKIQCLCGYLRNLKNGSVSCCCFKVKM